VTTRGGTRPGRLPRLLPPLLCLLLAAGCSAGPPVAARPPGTPAPSSHPDGGPLSGRPGLSPLQTWLRDTPEEIAHRGGDADWPEGTAYAYRQAAARNTDLALEVPVWRTADGVWVVSEDRSTGRVFGRDLDIPSTSWATLSRLRTLRGGRPMARLREDVLDVYGTDRVLFVDDKADTDAAAFLDLLDSYAGRSRYVVKSYWRSTAVAAEARRRGYLTWGYYDDAALPRLAATQARFDLLGLPWSAPAAEWAAARATGKPVIAHVVATAAQAARAREEGARGLMVSGVDEVVPGTAARPAG
jgi:glycerophosphoryl diester phosphodiesterase